MYDTYKTNVKNIIVFSVNANHVEHASYIEDHHEIIHIVVIVEVYVYKLITKTCVFSNEEVKLVKHG